MACSCNIRTGMSTCQINFVSLMHIIDVHSLLCDSLRIYCKNAARLQLAATIIYSFSSVLHCLCGCDCRDRAHRKHGRVRGRLLLHRNLDDRRLAQRENLHSPIHYSCCQQQEAHGHHLEQLPARNNKADRRLAY